METYTIIGCARCGQTHEATFKLLTNRIEAWERVENSYPVPGAPPEIEAQGVATFEPMTFDRWALCPVTGEPILMFTKTKK